jgi:hypothetical protein
MSNSALSRRWFLRRSVALAAFPGAPTVGLAAIAVRPATLPRETPELLELGRELADAEAGFDHALARKLAAIEHCENLWPAPPAELIHTGPTCSFWVLYDEEKNIWGEGMMPSVVDGKHYPPRRIYSAKRMRKALVDYNGRTRVGRFLRRTIPIAEQYEAAQEHAQDQSDLFGARGGVDHAGWNICAVGKRINATRAVTLEGVAIKAKVCVLWARCRDRCRCSNTQWFGDSLAEDVVRIATA